MNTNELLNNVDSGFVLEIVEGIDQSTVENAGLQFTVVQWMSGDVQASGDDWRRFAGWIMKRGVVDDAKMEAAGWKLVEWTHANGEMEEVWWKREIVVSVIARRRRWEVYSDGSNRPALFAWPKYNEAAEAGRATSRYHVMVIIKGLEDAGPVVLTLKGTMSMSFEGAGNDPGVLGKFAQTVITGANRLSDDAARKAGKRGGKRWPIRAFWLPVGANRDKDGKPVYTKVGQGNNTRRVVLPIALGLPDKATDVTVETLKRFYVGNDLLTLVNELYEEAATGWATAWDSIESGSTEGDAPAGTEGSADDAPGVDDNTLADLGL